MRSTIIAATLASVSLFGGTALQAKEHSKLDPAATKALTAAVDGTQRSDANRARDAYRHPVETLSFIGVKPTDTVVELWPGGGWYSEILAPYLADKGKLIAAAPAGTRRRIDGQAHGRESRALWQGRDAPTSPPCSAARV